MEENLQNRQDPQGYDRIASVYDRWMPLIEKIMGISRARPMICAEARGEVLDVATGTGRNFPHFPSRVHITGIDLSTAMLEHARARAASLGLQARLLVADATSLPFSDESFDTVIDALGLCSYDDPTRVIREMARVCRRQGQLLFLEHGQSTVSLIGKLQALRDRMSTSSDCHWNRQPSDLVEKAGIPVIECRQSRFGIISAMRAKPTFTPKA